MNCSACQRENPDGASFCNGCGRRLAPAPGRERVPVDYTPRHLAERILTQRSALEGERKHVTVLFVDIKGSMDLSADVDPEEWHRVIDRFFTIVSDGVHRFEGTVNQYTGDGVMALFGAPIAHEDHAQRAAHAALRLQREIRSYAQQLRREYGLDFHVRMGMNSGEVIVGRIGDDLRMDYTAQGQTVGLASRLEGIAEPGTTYLSQQTADLVQGYFDLEDLGEFKLKGARAPVRAWALGGVGRARTRLEVARSRGFSRFVGRDAELRELERALERAASGEGQVVGVVGEPGVGKSRLCFQFLERCREGGVPVNEARGVAHGAAIPFLPIREYLRNIFEIGEEDSPLQARRKVAGALLLLDPESADDLPVLFDFLGIPEPDAPAPSEGGGADRRILPILLRMREASAGRGLVVIHLEDLHWFDSGSRAVVDGLVDSVPGTRTLLLLNYRPELEAAWRGRPGVGELALEPLGPQAAAELLADWLGEADEIRSLAARVRAQAGGNPFYIEEIVRSLVESGTLVGKRGAYRLAGPIDALALPPSVQALVAARIDRLAEPEKELLQTAAVIGKEFAESVLRAATRLSERELAERLGRLTDADFVYEQSAYPERVLAFCHPVTQEVAYGAQLSERRTAVHSAVAAALSGLYRDAPDEHAALVAHHWERAGNTIAAARWTHRAASWLGASDSVEGMALWRKLRSLLADVPDSPERARLGARACRWLLFLGQRQRMSRAEADELLREGRGYAEATRDERALALTLANYALFRVQKEAAYEEGVARIREAVTVAERVGHAPLVRQIRSRLARALRLAGRFAEAVAEAEAVVGELSRWEDLEEPNLVLGILSATGELGDYERAWRTLEQSAKRPQTDEIRVGWRNDAVRWACALDDRARAQSHAEDAMRVAEKSGNPWSLFQAHASLGLAHQLEGRFDEAVASAERSLRLIDEHHLGGLSKHFYRAQLALAYLGAGRLERAREESAAAAVLADRLGPRLAPGVRLARARVLRTLDGASAAPEIEAQLDAADREVEATEARLDVPYLAEERGRLAELRGDEQEYRARLVLAQQGYAALGITTHAARLAEELGG